MANVEKHKRNLVHDWLEGDEGVAPAQSRSAHVTGAQGKEKPVRRFRSPAPAAAAPKPDPALIREPAPPKMDEKHSQASSPEHLRKLQRLSRLRAPFVKSTRPGRA